MLKLHFLRPYALESGLLCAMRVLLQRYGSILPSMEREMLMRIVRENHLTTLMITHNMKDAITYGNRLIMMHEGHVVVDVEGEEKKMLTVEDLLALFVKASGNVFSDDRTLLS